MLKKIFTTTATRILTSIASLGTVTVAARALGAEGMGTISLFILGISMIQMLIAWFGGSVLVYMSGKHPLIQLLVPAWIWALVFSAGGSLFLTLFNLAPAEFSFDLFTISFLQSVFAINQNIQIGKEKILQYNLAAISQSVVMLTALAILIWISPDPQPKAYIQAMYVSFSVAALLSFSGIYKQITPASVFNKQVIKEVFRFGGYVQTAGILQLFNYRLSYYLIEKFFDRATLGVFSIGVQISESVWIISKSIALVQYSRISNSNDNSYNVRITLEFIRFTAVFTLTVLLLLLLLPGDFFIFIFRSEFGNISEVILSISAGIFSVAISLMFSHYFSGSGKPWHNTISSGIGLIFTVSLGLILIPKLGITGAGLTSSIAYSAGMIYQLIVFKYMTKTGLLNFIPGPGDFRRINALISDMFRRN